MNKKFSTLVASVLLATSVGAYASAIDMSTLPTASQNLTVVQKLTSANPLGGYQVGVSYALQVSTTEYLAVQGGNLVLTTAAPISLTEAQAALWTLQQIVSPAGAVAPKYVFMNNATNQILAVDPSTAVAADKIEEANPIKVGGAQTEWLSAPSYKDPAAQANPIYAALAGDNVIALAKNSAGKVVLVKDSRTAIAEAIANPSTSEILTFKPCIYGAGSGFFLSAYDLNTMLGAAGNEATNNSYFNFSFDPEATIKGEDNLWTQDLQAVAVDQYEVEYGKEAKDAASAVTGNYASLYPLRKTVYAAGKSVKSITDSDLASFDNKETRWLAFKNRDSKYLVVDTSSIDGTSQGANLRMSFAMDGLFNAKNGTRFRNPESYLFSVLYNPSTKTIKIETKGYFNTPKTVANRDVALFDPATYYADYDNATNVTYPGARWTYGGTSATLEDNPDGSQAGKVIIKAALEPTKEVTVGTEVADPNNKFVIKLGVSSRYQLTHIASGAYLIKVYASDNAEKVGKYIVKNLKGGTETMEQAVRQNFQDMPAAQWIVSSTGTIDGSPVTIVNREFETSFIYSGMMYREATYPANVVCFNPGNGDVYQFIPVEKPNDKYLGYKYVSDKDIDVTTFTFNYLHDLAMDKPINTKSDKDSVVWVDKNGDETKFVLEKYKDDNYGTNGNLSGVAELTRRVYKVKVNDASKLENDGRYLAYDGAQKKYKVSASGDLFFLKENNEVEGGECYYALVKANMTYAGKLEVKLSENGCVEEVKTTNVTDVANYVQDNDIQGMFAVTKGTVINPNTGVKEEGYVPAFVKVNKDNIQYGLGYNYIPVTEAQYLAITLEAALPAGITKETSALANDVVTYNEYLKDTNDNVLCLSRFVTENSAYADYKVSVDNNTLDLVNGVLSNYSTQEVATSAFAVKPVEDPLYRRFNVEALGENADDVPNILKFFRVNATSKEYLYEDAQSVYSKDKGFNFLGVEGKGDEKNAAIYVDTAYVDRGTKMPQYLLALRPNIVKADTVLCDATNHSHKTLEEALACDHSKVTPGYVDAWYLVNLQDSIDYYNAAAHKDVAKVAKYQWNNQYTRLGFVEARHQGDTLIIKNSVYTGNNQPITIGKAATVASKDSIFLGNNKHKNVVFSFRIAKSGSNDFLIESETEKDGAFVKNNPANPVKIAPMNGGWVKIQNGVPVIANVTYNENGTDAEIFNVETTDEAPTANEGVEVSEVSIVAVNGAVIVKGAAGKNVVITNVLGKQIANETVSSDNATFAAPAGVVIVAVEGEEAVKVAVK